LPSLRGLDMPQPNDAGLQARVEHLEAREAIRDVKSKYARIADLVLGSPSEAHALALADLFTEDAVADYGFFGKFTGRAELLHAFTSVLPGGTRWSKHYIVNDLVTVNGDTAEGSFSFFIHAKPAGAPETPLVTFYGIYLEKFRRVNGTWKLSELTSTYSSPPA